MKIFLYACRFGAGHMQAARFIQQQLEPAYETEIFDVPGELFPNTAPIIYKTYSHFVKKQNLIYRLYLKADGNKEDLIPKLTWLENIFFRWMDRQELPDVFIATYSLVAFFLARYKKTRGLDIPLVTCITDFMPHRFWVNEETAMYLVASEYTKEQLEKVGIPREKILIFGLSENKLPLLHEESKHSRNILVTGGGLGLLPKEMSFYYQLRENYGDQIRVICGKNKELYKKLIREDIPGLEVFGYVQNMPEQWIWADVVVGKAGGLSTFEAIQAETPILYLTPYLPQEKRNAEFIRQSRIGKPLWSREFAEDDPERILNACRYHMKEMKEDLAPEDFMHWLTVQGA